MSRISQFAFKETFFKSMFFYILVLIFFISNCTKTQSWSQLPASNNPPPRTNASSIYIASSNRMVMYGGRNSTGSFNDIWSLDLNTNFWQNITPATGPVPASRFSQNAVYDSLMNRMLIWSGQGAELYNDVWAFNLNSNTWQQLSPDGNASGVPLKRYGTAAVFDHVNRRLVSFAGFTTSGRFEDTWSFQVDSMKWTDRTNSFHPELRCLHSACLSADRSKMIIYGGQHSGALSDIWSLNLNTFVWTNITPVEKPAGRYFSQIVCTNTGKAIIFGGQTPSSILGDLWKYTFDTSRWDSVDQGMNKPSARWGHTSVYSKTSDKLIIFGGNDGDYRNDVWQFSNISTVGINTLSSTIPEKFQLLQNYPNPFNPVTKIRYNVINAGIVNLNIYDINGKLIKELVKSYRLPGNYEEIFDGTGINSGIYFIKFSDQKNTLTSKMILLK